MDRSGDVLQKLRERIVRFAASRLTGDSAEDVAQDVMVVLEEKYKSVQQVGELVPLSIEIARFKIMALRRKNARRGEYDSVSVEDLPLASSTPDPFEQASRRQDMDRLAAAVRELGERCKRLIRLKLEGLNFAAIQREMGADSLNTVYTWDFRCRKQLLEKLGGEWTGKGRESSK